MNFRHVAAGLAFLLAGWTCTAPAQTIFNQNFDGGYTGTFGTSSYAGGSPSGGTNYVISTGGNPNGAWQESMTPTTANDYYTGQVQLMTVTGNSDTNPADYLLSFDAKGSQAANLQFIVQTWSGTYYGGSLTINATVNDPLTAANSWQPFMVNLGSITSANANGGTWQLNFQINASQWGGPGQTDTVAIDNIVLQHQTNPIQLTASPNPSTFGSAVNFTATVRTNGVKAGNATGTVVFAYAGRAFSTNAVSGGSATSASITNLPVGTDLVMASYFGGNYSGSTNTLNQVVNIAAGVAQANLALYTDNLVNGFQNWSWAAVNAASAAPSPVHSGTYALSVTDRGNYQALVLARSEFNTTPYSSLSFWIHGGTAGGQQLQVWGLLNGTNQVAYPLAPLAANTWRQIIIPLASLGVSNRPNVTGFWLQGNAGGAAQPTFYVDDVQLVAASTPAVVHLGIDAGPVLRTVDARHFGLNAATWDASLGNNATLARLQEMGCQTLRWPGGSTSDEYHWAADPGGNAIFTHLATNLSAQVFTTVNYGTGTPAEAAAWVLAANKTNGCGFKYWEIGNECYGTWETDSNAVPHDPYTYATRAASYLQQMKAAYPNVPIRVGVVVAPGEGTYVNNSNHFAYNSRTHTTNYGWTPIVLSQLKSLGVIPDFLIHHFYWQYTTSGWMPGAASSDSDALLLQVAENPCPLNWSDWASAAANLRQQITDYLGPTATNVELCVTENNCDAGAMGRQSTSLVNALYLADSTSQLIKTEFKSYLWWDLQNGADTSGDFDPTLYGWRLNGDYGVLDAAANPYPTFYAEKLLQYFARPADAVLNATSDSLLLSAYAVHRTNGALSLLVINKAMTTNLLAQIVLTNFIPAAAATIRSYGLPQDLAAQTNAAAGWQDVATTNFPAASANFSYAFPPLSLTLFTLAPAPATLSVAAVKSGQVQLLLHGQPGTPYVLQSSADLRSWTAVATNSLVTNSLTITLPVAAGATHQYYRSLWQP